jgi:hypothetical protein
MHKDEHGPGSRNLQRCLLHIQQQAGQLEEKLLFEKSRLYAVAGSGSEDQGHIGNCRRESFQAEIFSFWVDKRTFISSHEKCGLVEIHSPEVTFAEGNRRPAGAFFP